MENRKTMVLIGALVFLLLSAACLYRLFAGFPFMLGEYKVGGTLTFIGFAGFAALSLMLFHAARGKLD
jgi:hypothetical protein